jgi:hypothetical protein
MTEIVRIKVAHSRLIESALFMSETQYQFPDVTALL